MTTVNPLFVKLCIPTGLEEVLEGLAREVLRRQPENINGFAAVYFDKLLAIRNEAEKRGSSVNLQNLITRGKLLDISEDDLIKICTKDEPLVDGDETNFHPDKKIQSNIVTAAVISKPEEIQISGPLNVAVNKSDDGVDPATEDEEQRESDGLEKVTVETKVATNQESGEIEVQENRSEKSSDNSEMDKEQLEDLESELETTLGLQEDTGEESLMQNEDVNDILQEPMKDGTKLDNLEELIALDSQELQLNDKPAEIFEDIENTKLPSDQSVMQNFVNEKLEIVEILEENSDEFLTNDQIPEVDEDLRLKPVVEEVEDFDDTKTIKDDEIDKNKTLEADSSNEFLTSIEIGEIYDTSSLKPIVEEREDSVDATVAEDDDTIKVLETSVLEEPTEIIETNAMNEITETVEDKQEIQDEVMDNLTSVPMFNEIEPENTIVELVTDKEDTEANDDNDKETDMESRRETEQGIMEERNAAIIAETITADTREGSQDPEVMITVQEISGTQIETELTVEPQDEEIYGELQDNRSENETEQTEVVSSSVSETEQEGIFEVQALRQQPEVLREITIQDNLSADNVIKETTIEVKEEEFQESLQTVQNLENVEQTESDINQEKSIDEIEDKILEDKDKTDEQFAEVLPTVQITEDSKQVGAGINELESIDNNSNADQIHIQSDTQSLSQEVDGIQEMKIDRNISEVIASEEAGDEPLEFVQTISNMTEGEAAKPDILTESTIAMEVSLLDDQTDKIEEFQEVSQAVQDVREEELPETEENQLEATAATEVELIETAKNKNDEEPTIEAQARFPEEPPFPTERTDVLPEVLQTVQKDPVEEQTETEVNQVESTVESEVQLIQDTENANDEVSANEAEVGILEESSGNQTERRDTLSDDSQTVQNDPDEEQQGTEVNQLKLTETVEAEVEIIEDTENKNDEESGIEAEVKFLEESPGQQTSGKDVLSEYSHTVQNDPVEEQEGTEVNQLNPVVTVEAEVELIDDTENKIGDESTVEAEVRVLEEDADQIEVKDPLSETSQTVLNDIVEEQTVTDDNLEESIVPIESEILEESTQINEENAFEGEIQEISETNPDAKNTDNQLESTDPPEEHDADQMGEELIILADAKLVEQSTMNTEGMTSADAFEDVTQSAQNEGAKEGNQEQPKIATEAGLLDDETDKTQINMDEGQPQSQGLQNLRETELSENASEVNDLEETTNEFKADAHEDEFQEIPQADKDNRDEKQPETEYDLEEPVIARAIEFPDESSEKIQDEFLENGFEENSQSVPSATIDKPSDLEEISSLTNDQLLEEISDEIENQASRDVQESSQTVQQSAIENNAEVVVNQMESTNVNSSKMDAEGTEESQQLLDSVGFESAIDDEDLANSAETDVGVPGQITYDMQDSEGQEIEDENKLAEERNGNELANTKNDDSLSAEVNDTLKTEAPEGDADFIDQEQNADELVTLDENTDEIKILDAESNVENEELEATTADNAIIMSAEYKESLRADEMVKDDKLKDEQEEAKNIAEENLINLITNDRQNEKQADTENIIEDLSENKVEETALTTAETSTDEQSEENGVGIKVSVNEEQQTNDVQENVTPEQIKYAAIDEEIGANAKSIDADPQMETTVNDATILTKQVEDNNLDDIKNDSKDMAESLTINNPEEIEKTEDILENPENQLQEKIAVIENVRLGMEEIVEDQTDETTQSKQEFGDDGLEMPEENAQLDSVLPDESEVTKEVTNQIETAMEKGDEVIQQIIDGKEIESVDEIKNENKMEVIESIAIEEADAILDESINALNTSNVEVSLPVSDQLQTSDPLSPMEETSQSQQKADIEQEPRMENQMISKEMNKDETEIGVEIGDQIEKIEIDALIETEQIDKEREISEEAIVPEIDQKLNMELANNQDQLTESNQLPTLQTDKEEEIPSATALNSEDVDISSKAANDALEEQISENIMNDILEVENDAIMDLDSLEYDNKRTEVVFEAQELDSLEMSQVVEVKSSLIDDGQELDSLEANKTVQSHHETKTDLLELEGSSQVDKNSMIEDNFEIELNEQNEAEIDSGIPDSTALLEESLNNNFQEIQGTNENELEAELITKITDKIDEQSMGNNDTTTELAEDLESSVQSEKVEDLLLIEKTRTESMAEKDEPTELAIEPDIIGKDDILQVVDNATIDFVDLEPISDRKTDQDDMLLSIRDLTTNISAKEIEKNERPLVSDETVDENVINPESNEKQFSDFDELLTVLNKTDNELIGKIVDEKSSNSAEIKAVDMGAVAEINKDVSLETNEDLIVEEQVEELVEEYNEGLKEEDASGLTSNDIQTIPEAIIMKAVAVDIESSNDEINDLIENADNVDLSKTEEEVNEPEIIKEIEQLEEPDFTELYSKLENNNDAGSGETQENKNETLEIKKENQMNVSEEIANVEIDEANISVVENLTEDELKQQTGEEVVRLENAFSSQEILQKDLEELNPVEAIVALEILEDTVASTAPEMEIYVNEGAVVTDGEIEVKHGEESFSNDQPVNIDSSEAILIANKQDENQQIAPVSEENFKPDQEILNQDENYEYVSKPEAEADEDIQEKLENDDGPILLENNSTVNNEEFPSVDNVMRKSENDESNSDVSAGEPVVDKTENMETLRDLETDKAAEDNPTAAETEVNSTADETVENKQSNINGETLTETEVIESVRKEDITDAINSNATTDNTLTTNGQEINTPVNTTTNGEPLVGDANVKPNDRENAEMVALTKQIDEAEALESMMEDSGISESEINQMPEKITTDDIQRNENEFLIFDEQNQIDIESSIEIAKVDQKDKSESLTDAKVVDEPVMTSSTTQSLQMEQSSGSESMDLKNTLATQPLTVDEDNPEGKSEEESKPENQNQEEFEIVRVVQGLENEQENTANYKQVEITGEQVLNGEPIYQPEAENADVGEDVIKPYLDGNTDEVVTVTDAETEAKNDLSNIQLNEDVTQNSQLETASKTARTDVRKSRENGKTDVKNKENAKEESSINGFEVLGQSIVLKPKKNHDKIEQRMNETDDNQIMSKFGIEGQDYRNAPEITVEISSNDDYDDFKGTSKEIKDFVDIIEGEQYQLDNSINDSDDQDEDNDVMIGQGLTSPPEEQGTRINTLVP